MPIMKFSSDEEVVKLANDSKYGLGCAVFSGNQQRARKIASQIHCGIAAINDFASNYMCQVILFIFTWLHSTFELVNFSDNRYSIIAHESSLRFINPTKFIDAFPFCSLSHLVV